MAKTPAKTEAPKTEVATTKAALPAFMQGAAGQGIEKIGMEDVETPRLVLIQSSDSDRKQTYDVREGVFFHDVLEEDWGNELTITPIYVDKRAVLWRPRPPIDQGGILARSEDLMTWRPSNVAFNVRVDKAGRQVTWNTGDSVADSGLMDWGSYDPQDPNSQPAATLVYNLVCMCHEHLDAGPFVVSLQRTGLRPGKKLLGRLKLSTAPVYGTKLIMKSVSETGPSGAFFNYSFTADGFVDDEDLYRKFQASYELISKSGLKIKDEEGIQNDGMQNDAPSAATGKQKF